MDAALSVRDDGRRSSDLMSLFYKSGGYVRNEMSFYVEMIVPEKGVDDLGQEAQATITFLSYEIVIKYNENESTRIGNGKLTIVKEELKQINASDAEKHLYFEYEGKWKKSVIKGKRPSKAPFISTNTDDEGRNIIELHIDKGSGGRPQKRNAFELPRTVLSATNTNEYPTVLLARKEMESWKILQLEPSALRKPDEFTSGNHLEPNGTHLPSTIFRLINSNRESDVCGRISARLSSLVEDFSSISIERDDKRELLSIKVTRHDKATFQARSLSDGTLRFLALAVIEQDEEFNGVLCMEEPENGIHPARIKVMIDLLSGIACDTRYDSTEQINPLRQVIINTHSPLVVQQIPDESLLMVSDRKLIKQGKQVSTISISHLPKTWRHDSVPNGRNNTILRGVINRYLNPVVEDNPVLEDSTLNKRNRVLDNELLEKESLKLFY